MMLLVAFFIACGLGDVIVKDGQLLVNGKTYVIRGLCYSPVPTGESVNFIPFGDYFTPNYAYIWARDFPRIKQLGFNTIRIYGWNTALDHSLFLDTLDAYGLKVMVTFFLGTSDQNSAKTPEERQGLIDQFTQEAQRYGRHPALLMWSFGNELNGAWNGYIKQFSDVGGCGYDVNCFYSTDSKCIQRMKCTYSLLFSWINAACQAAKAYSPRPCTSGFADVDVMLGGSSLINKISLFNPIVPSLDIWAMQVYRGATFGQDQQDFFKQYRAQGVAKPVLITEYGVDAYNDPCGWNENQGKVCTMLPGDPGARGGDTPGPKFVGCPEGGACATAGALVQALWDLRLTSAIRDQGEVSCVGGFLMSWSDEYWKGSATQDKCAKPCELADVAQCRAAIEYTWPWQASTMCTERAHFTCDNFNTDFHDLCGYFLPGASYDNYVNEEWFGITKPAPCGQSGNFGAFRLDALVPRNATGQLAALFSSQDIPAATCGSLTPCHQCSIRHTATRVAQGVCNTECNMKASAPLEDWDLLQGDTKFFLGLLCATALFAGLPLLGCSWRYRKRRAVAKLFPGAHEVPAPQQKLGKEQHQITSTTPYRDPESNIVVLGLRLQDKRASFVYYNKPALSPDPKKIASIDEPFAILLERTGGENAEEQSLSGAMLLEHVKLQCLNLSAALSHELRNCSSSSQAVGVLHYRMFEAYMCWLEKHRFAPKKTGNLVGEILVLRVIQSLCDHILHCPERVSQIVHTVFGTTAERGDGVFRINLDFIQNGLSTIHAGEEPLNFDDINQAGAINSNIGKAWFESTGFGVCLDVLRVEYPIIFVKGWIFSLVIWLQLIIVHNEPPLLEGLEFWEIVAHIDSVLYLFVETLLFVYTVVLQERHQALEFRSWHKAFGVGLALLSVAWMWVHFRVGVFADEQVRYLVLALYFGLLRILMFVVYLPVVERWFGRDSQFVRYGRPLWARKLRRRTLEHLANRGAGLAENLLQSVMGNLAEEERRQRTFCGMLKAPCGDPKPVLFWFVVLILTVGLEFTIVSPIALGFTFHPMCDQSCSGAFSLSQINLLNSRCVACVSSLFFIYAIIAISCLVDTHFIFQFVLALVGYCMGNARGLRGVLQSDSLFHPTNHTDALLSLFGTSEHAEEVWAALIADLFSRDLISDEQRDALVSLNLLDECITDYGVVGQLLREPRERLLFFMKTLPVLANQTLHPARSVRNYIQHGAFHYDEGEFCHSIPTVSQVVTTYTEEIIKSAAFLRQQVGAKSNLEYLIEAHPLEWSYLEQRLTSQMKFGLSEPLQCCFLASQVSPEVEMEVRLWASYRTQTVARTIRGALAYHITLGHRLSWVPGEKLKLKDMVELVVAAQTYGQRKDPEAVQRRQDLDYLLTSLKEYPISIVFDYNADNCDQEDKDQINAYWMNCHANAFPFPFATVVKALDSSGQLALQAVLPRRYPLRLGKGAYQTQGKAANHLNALRKVWGHVTQVLDANMDGFIGEAYKVPFITHMFLENSQPTEFKEERPMYSFVEQEESPSSSDIHARKTVVHRIIGFREYIFTAGLGGVASIMANSEKAFGTITQRVLGHPLGVRMHYGHPDFFDSFWMLNRGGPSKASPNINLSEDIFSGFNVWLRDEMAAHVDTIEWQKGREESFTTASMFMSKITAGSVGILRTREFMHMNHGLDIITKLSLLCGGVGYYLAQWLVSTGIKLFAITMFLLTLSRASIDELRLFDAALSIQWVLGFGLCTALPSLSEEVLERGFFRGILEWASTYVQGTVFYLFHNQGVARAFLVGARTGLAPYANTGRPSFFSPYSKELAYRLYVQSHYYPAYFVMFLAAFRVAQIPTFSATLSVVSVIVGVWLFGPVLFCPLSDVPTIFWNDVKASFRFLFTSDGNTLWNFWLETNQKAYSEPRATRFVDLISSVVNCALLFLLDSPVGALSYYAYLLFIVCYFLICLALYRVPWVKLALLPLPFVFILIGPVLNVFGHIPFLSFGPETWRVANVSYGHWLLRSALVYCTFKLFLDIWLWVFSWCLAFHRYRACVDFCFWARCAFPAHLLIATLTLLAQTVLQLIFLSLLWPFKLTQNLKRCRGVHSKEPLLGHRESING